VESYRCITSVGFNSVSPVCPTKMKD